MPGGTGDEGPVAATSKRLICWASKVSPLGCHHSGAMPAVGPAGTDEVPVHSHAWLLFQVVTALVAATAVLGRYRDEIAKANAIIAATPLDAMPKWWPDFFGNFPPRPLRKTILHVITETAAHAGHLDAARELIDGGQWLVLTR